VRVEGRGRGRRPYFRARVPLSAGCVEEAKHISVRDPRLSWGRTLASLKPLMSQGCLRVAFRRPPTVAYPASLAFCAAPAPGGCGALRFTRVRRKRKEKHAVITFVRERKGGGLGIARSGAARGGMGWLVTGVARRQRVKGVGLEGGAQVQAG